MAPPDKLFLAWNLCMMQGLAALFPWNMFIDGVDIWQRRWPKYTQSVAFLVTIAYNLTGVSMLLVSVKYGPRFSFRSRMTLGYLLCALSMALVGFFTTISSDAGLFMMLASMILAGAGACLLMGTAIGFVSALPPQYTTAVMVGNGIAGLLASAIRFGVKFLYGDSHDVASAILYFSIGTVILLTCLFTFYWLEKLDFVRFHTENSADELAINEITEDKDSLLDGSNEVSIKSVFGKIWAQCFNVYFVFFVTLALFPGLAPYGIEPSSLGDNFGLILITIFQFGDLIGRALPRLFMLPKKPLLIANIARIVFGPLFVFSIKPHLFTMDWIPMVVMVAFSVSNGYFGTLGMIYAPQDVQEKEKQTAGILASFFLNLGILSASFFGLFILWVVKGSGALPF